MASDSVWCNTLVISSIIIAGILVGVQTYPQMDDNMILTSMDTAVQTIFTLDCVFKIFREGKNPLNFW